MELTSQTQEAHVSSLQKLDHKPSLHLLLLMKRY